MEETRRDQDSTVCYTKSVSYSDPLLGQSGAVQSWQDGRRMDASGSLSQCKSNLNTQVKCTELQPGPEGRSNRSRGEKRLLWMKRFFLRKSLHWETRGVIQTEQSHQVPGTQRKRFMMGSDGKAWNDPRQDKHTIHHETLRRNYEPNRESANKLLKLHYKLLNNKLSQTNTD